MAADAGVSFGVVVAALVIMLTGWLWVDPAISLVISAVVLASGWGLARDSVNLALDGVPRGIELAKVRDYLGALEGVSEVHDLHIWAMSTNETALTVHLVRPGGTDDTFPAPRLRRTLAPFQHSSRHVADRGQWRGLQARAGGAGVGRGRASTCGTCLIWLQTSPAMTKLERELLQIDPTGNYFRFTEIVSSLKIKIFRFSRRAKQCISIAIPFLSEGRFMIATNVGWDAVDAGSCR